MTTPSANGYGIVIAGHGSRDPEGVAEFEAMIGLLKRQCPQRPITHGFLEFCQPTIDEAIRANVQAGSRRIALVPGVLLAAMHAKNDMPSELLAMQRQFPEVEMRYASALELHPSLLVACRERIEQAEARGGVARRSQSCLVVVGRGTTDPDANSQVSKLARMLEEGLGFGASFVCYSGTATPGIADGLSAAARLGFPRLVVLPFFLFTGVLVKRIFAVADTLRKERPDLEVLSCNYLGLHAAVPDLLLSRAEESMEGRAATNCGLCKYRVQIVGYEREVGSPQQAHHFHVRGKNGEDAAAHASDGRPHSRVAPRPYEPHPIEERSFQIIAAARDWSGYSEPTRSLLQRLVHTTGEPGCVDDIFVSAGAIEAGLQALAEGAFLVTDVTMVRSGLKRKLLEQLGLQVFCGVHDEETHQLAAATGLTRSAAGVRRAWEKFGNHTVIGIGDAPTAVEEAVRLVKEERWRPHLIIGLPVGFVGTAECKEALRRCVNVPRITNRGAHGGSPWAAAALNALLIHCVNQQAKNGP